MLQLHVHLIFRFRVSKIFVAASRLLHNIFNGNIDNGVLFSGFSLFSDVVRSRFAFPNNGRVSQRRYLQINSPTRRFRLRRSCCEFYQTWSVYHHLIIFTRRFCVSGFVRILLSKNDDGNEARIRTSDVFNRRLRTSMIFIILVFLYR